MEAILEKLIESLRLALYQREIQRVLEAEQIRREHFIETMPDTGKNEFINGQVVVQSPSQLNEILASQHFFVLLDVYVDSRNLGFAGCEKMLISLTRNDRGVKFDDYAAHGVAEYWIIDPDEEIVEQYWLDGDHYRLAYKVGSGTLTSRAVDGFEIPVAAIFDTEVNLAVLRRFL